MCTVSFKPRSRYGSYDFLEDWVVSIWREDRLQHSQAGFHPDLPLQVLASFTRGCLSRTRAWQGAVDSNWKASFHVGTLQTLLGLFWALGPPLSFCWCFRKPCGLSGCSCVTAGPRTTMPRLPWSLGRSLFLHNLSTTWFSRLSSVKLVCFHPWNYIHLGNTSSY